MLTTPYDGAAEWDRQQPFTVVRAREPVLLPTPSLRRRIDRLADETGAELVVLDPALPLGHLGPALRHPYAVVVHGAEVTVPGRLPGSRSLLGRVLRGARLVVAAGGYPAAEARARRRDGAADRRGAARCRRRALPAAGRRRRRRRPCALRPARPTCRWWSRSAGWCPARGSTA